MSAPLTFDPGEKVLLKVRRHWILFLGPALRVILVALIPFALYYYCVRTGFISPELAGTNIFTFIGVWWIIIAWCTLAVLWTDYYLDIWILTDRRVINIQQIELFDRNISTWDIDRIQEVTVRVQNFIQTMFGYGEVQIQTAGPTDEYARATGIPHPERIRATILTQASHVGALEKTNRDQEQLLHTVSHEVKSYLTKDAAALASIAESDPASVPGNVRTLATQALHETRQGVSAVTSMLESSDPKTGEMQIVKASCDLRTILKELVAEFEPMAKERGLSFKATLGRKKCIIPGDEIKLRDLVFRNLIDNAIRYTKKGSVHIELTQTDAAIVCTISDTGVGISESDMARLFTEGGKGEHSSEVNPGSTGFGLAAAKRIIDAHEGTITVNSKGEGQGTSFIVALPLEL